MRTLLALPLLSLLVLSPSGCTPAPAGTKPAAAEKARKTFGPAADVLAGATKVEVFRVDRTKAGADGKKVGPFYVTATAKDQDETFAGKLAAVVLNDDSYEWDIAKGCVFQPGVAYKVWKGEEAVVVAVCFSCDQVWVGRAKDEKVSDGAIAESDPSRPALLKLAKTALPDDADIQKLTDKK